MHQVNSNRNIKNKNLNSVTSINQQLHGNKTQTLSQKSSLRGNSAHS